MPTILLRTMKLRKKPAGPHLRSQDRRCAWPEYSPHGHCPLTPITVMGASMSLLSKNASHISLQAANPEENL